MRRKIVLVTASIFLPVFLADALVCADPAHNVPPPLHVRSIGGKSPYLFELMIAVLEALLLAIMMRRLGFKSARIFLIWLPIAWTTFILLVKFCKLMTDVYLLLKIITGELTIIILEATLLYLISLSSFFYRERTGPLTTLMTIKLSMIINIASLLVYFMLFFLLLLVVTASESGVRFLLI